MSGKRFVYTAHFKKDYRRLPENIKQAFAKQIRFLQENPDHPSLDIKKMKDPRGIWRCKLTAGYRFTFQIDGDTYLLRRIGPHDVEKKP